MAALRHMGHLRRVVPDPDCNPLKPKSLWSKTKIMHLTSVILDFGCVLSLAPSLEDFLPMSSEMGVDAERFQRSYWQFREAYDVDEIDNATYWEEVAHAAGINPTPEKIQRLSILDGQMWARSNPVMVEWVRILRARGMKLGLLSNMPRAVAAYLRQNVPSFGVFDHLCISGEIRTGKPGLAIYRACLEALGVPPSEALFIDDREVNVSAGVAAGMHGIVFRSVEQLPIDLEPFGLAESMWEALARTKCPTPKERPTPVLDEARRSPAGNPPSSSNF